jgi:SAM-dependent methyltransferase
MGKEGLLSPLLRKKRLTLVVKYCKDRENILDVGSHYGEILNFMDRQRIKIYTGIDICAEAIKHSLRKWPEYRFYCIDVEGNFEIPGDIKYDCIIMSAVWEHLKNPEKVLREISRFLVENGYIIITTPHPLGEKILEIGSRIGLLSREAIEQHKELFDKKKFEIISASLGFKIKTYKRFLLGFNQLVILTKS